MSDTCSADPERLLRFVGAVDDLDACLIPEAAALRTALDGVRRACPDHRPVIPSLDLDLCDLRARVDQLSGHFCTVGLRFLAADGGWLWPGVSGLSEWVRADIVAPSGLHGPPSPLATLILVAGGPPLGDDDLTTVGHALLGISNRAKPLVDVLGPVVTGSTLLLASPSTRDLAERLARVPAVQRVLRGLSSLPTESVVKAAGRGLTALTLLGDLNRLRRDGNPWNAWHRKGAGYIADWAGAGFDGTSTVCAEAPNPFACGAAVTTGMTWVAAESWTHRRAISRTSTLAYQAVIAEVRHVRSLASQALESVGVAREGLIRTIRDLDRGPGLVRLPSSVTHEIAGLVEDGSHMAGVAGAAAQRGEKLISKGFHWLGDHLP